MAAALVALVSLTALAATSGCSRNTGSSADRTVHVTFTFEPAAIPANPTVTASFTNYADATVALGRLRWQDDRHVNVDFFLPGLGDDRVDATFKVETPLLEGVLKQYLPMVQPVIVEMHPPGPPAPDGGGAGGGMADSGGGGMTGAGGGSGGRGETGGSGGADGGEDVGQGGDAGHQTIGGGGTAGGSMGGAGGCDAGDEDTGPTMTIPSCDEYCTALMRYCPAYADNCMNICLGLHWDRIPINPNNVVSNNLRCRIDNAQHFDPDNPPMCVNSTTEPQEPGGCGSPCDVLCDAGRSNCPTETFFADPVTCRDDCRLLTPTNRKCRVDSLVQAGLGINSQQECLQASQGTGCQ